MQVVKDGIVKDYYISKSLPDNPSMKLLNNKLKYAERLVNDREKYLEEQYSELNRREHDLDRSRNGKNQKRLEDQQELIEWSLYQLKVEKEDLEALKNIIEMKIFLG